MYKSLILLLLLAGCTNCPKDDWKPYKFDEKVEIRHGFYKGQTGRIRSQEWLYNAESCNVHAFNVELDVEGHPIVKISQYDLYAPELE